MKIRFLILSLAIGMSLGAPPVHADPGPPTLAIFNKTAYRARVIVERKNAPPLALEVPQGAHSAVAVNGDVGLVGRIARNGSLIELPRLALRLDVAHPELVTITESAKTFAWNTRTVAVDASGGFQ